jgi:hypothetical protein
LGTLAKEHSCRSRDSTRWYRVRRPRPDHGISELAEPDARWADYADDYIDYVVDRIMRWGGPTKMKVDGLEAFDPWLVRTGRRQPVGHMAN